MWSSAVAQAVALDLLGDDERRLAHVVGVAQLATRLAAAGAVDLVEGDVLVAAAWVHDIGYASGIGVTGFHHLDGARWLRDQGEERLAGLVAFHTGGCWEAACRGLAGELAAFEDEHSPVSDALAYCDLSVDAQGHTVTLEERAADIRSRYDSASPVVVALAEGWDAFVALVARVDARAAAIR